MKTSQSELSEYNQIPTAWGPLHIHVNYNKKGPTKIFCNLPPVGSDWSTIISLIGILLTKYFESGGNPEKIIKHLQTIKSDKTSYWDEEKIESIPHAISLVLKKHLERHKNGVGGDSTEIN